MLLLKDQLFFAASVTNSFADCRNRLQDYPDTLLVRLSLFTVRTMILRSNCDVSLAKYYDWILKPCNEWANEIVLPTGSQDFELLPVGNSRQEKINFQHLLLADFFFLQ